jgi:type I restriction enzyme S subunit
VPSIEKQLSIVKAYKTITDRIALKQQINEKLEETAQAIFEKIVNKKSGEKENIELDSIIEFIDGDRGTNYPKQEEFYDDGFCLFLNASNVTAKGFNFESTSFITEEKDKALRKGKLTRNDIILTSRGTVGNIAFYGKNIPYDNIRINSGMLILRPKNKKYPAHFIYALLKSQVITSAIEKFKSGSAQPQLPIKDLKHISFSLPWRTFDFTPIAKNIELIDDMITLNNNETWFLNGFCNILLSTMTKEDFIK